MDSRVLRKWTTTSHFKWYTNALKFNYSLHNHILQQVENSKYLGAAISNDLDWGSHINNVLQKPIRLPTQKHEIVYTQG